MNYGFAVFAYFSIFACWYAFMYLFMDLADEGLYVDDNEAKGMLLYFIKFLASLMGISLIAGVIQWIIEL